MSFTSDIKKEIITRMKGVKGNGAKAAGFSAFVRTSGTLGISDGAPTFFLVSETEYVAEYFMSVFAELFKTELSITNATQDRMSGRDKLVLLCPSGIPSEAFKTLGLLKRGGQDIKEGISATLVKEETEKKQTLEGVREKTEKKPIFKRQPENRRINRVPEKQVKWTESKIWELESDDKTQITDPDQTVYRPELAKFPQEKKDPLCYLVPKQEKNPVIEIRELPFYIGRFQKDTDALKGMHSISRIHCKIEKDDALFYLSDLSSTNGTYHNSTKLTQGKKVVLQEGDLVAIADVTYRFALERP